jgi:hypothetical protein
METKKKFMLTALIDEFNNSNKEWNRAKNRHQKRSDIGRKYQDGILDMIIMLNNEREANKQ